MEISMNYKYYSYEQHLVIIRNDSKRLKFSSVFSIYHNMNIYILGLNCKNCDNVQQDDSLPESLDSNNNGILLLKSDSLKDMGFLNNPTKHPLNQAYLNELRLGIHDWKRSVEVHQNQIL